MIKETALQMYHINGFEIAKAKLTEECIELLYELNRFDTASPKKIEALLGEMFDVMFCITQLKFAFDKRQLEEIKQYKISKIKRLYIDV